jgi:hypothetical protein
VRRFGLDGLAFWRLRARDGAEAVASGSVYPRLICRALALSAQGQRWRRANFVDVVAWMQRLSHAICIEQLAIKWWS